jgi:hypothetical protein
LGFDLSVSWRHFLGIVGWKRKKEKRGEEERRRGEEATV